MRDLEKKRAWNRAWRKRNRAKIKKADRSEYFKEYNKTRPKRHRPAVYYREYRAKNRPIAYRRVPRIRKPTKTQLEEWRKKRLEELSHKTISEIVTDPELLKLIEEQERDDKTFCIKF